jgi:hypothetical protein
VLLIAPRPDAPGCTLCRAAGADGVAVPSGGAQTRGPAMFCMSWEIVKMKIRRTKIKSRAASQRFSWGKYFAALTFSLISLPVWAAHLDSMSWELHETTTIGSAQVEPGNYLFRAEEGQSELQIIQDGKVIAKVPCGWTHLMKKANESEIQILNHQMIQVQFAGRREAIQFNP